MCVCVYVDEYVDVYVIKKKKGRQAVLVSIRVVSVVVMVMVRY